MNVAMLAAFREANAKQPVDAVVGYLSGHNTDPRVLRTMAEEGAAIFNFCWDDTLSFPGKLYGGRYTSPAALAAEVDLNLTNVPASIVKYRVHGGLAAFLPEAADPKINKPYDLSFEYDVSFVGARYGWRPRFIQALERRGIHIECFGPGWPNGPLAFDEMVRLYSQSRINLGFSGIGHSKKICCLKGRDFEVPMSGGLYLTQEHPDLHRVYQVGREILTYSSVEDCAQKIRWALAHPGEAQCIRERGRERCLREHTYEACWTRVFHMAGILGEANYAE
jgi:spore maturation protein CgeB